MEEEKLIRMIKNNPDVIKTISHPTEEMKRLAVSEKGLVLAYIEDPIREIEELAMNQDVRAIKFIKEPTEEMMLQAVKESWVLLEFIKNPTQKILKLALEQSGWAIQYVKEPSEELQLLAVRKNVDAIKYIKAPYESVQEEAVKGSYESLRYIAEPSLKVETMAIQRNERAIQFIKYLDQAKKRTFLGVNSLVIKYIEKDITQEEVEEVLKEVVAQEDVSDKYIRDFLNCRTMDRVLSHRDKMLFIDRYGSKKAKKIAVDEKLKRI
ncbi:hypothetical protein CS063_06725 [Sporanaerobium hydrogeniformans]|uniref:Uncharacterized protein n=1 Tax=Sporanaerobium hydrogeniformans TaxID=3072179 RepID=A0AC61DCH9_9FIRM|nr:hypothetical protein [Sporanaerobium hydrogeniformans]PHV71024.1 hypothetical protein CS063_06725 [Sporanaerobium hydrogeniformans]